MMEAVHRYEGTVNQVMGDGIMALFGAPLAHEDHAVRACYAALRMQEQVTRLRRRGAPRRTGSPLQIRVGLNSGEVVVRSIGSDLRMDYTAVGQTTHLAARMEQMATPGTILAHRRDACAWPRVRRGDGRSGRCRCRACTRPLEVHEISGAVPIRSRLDGVRGAPALAAASGAPELVRLDGALDAMLAGPRPARVDGRRGRRRQVAARPRVRAESPGRGAVS